jgi:hypothetical protein
MATINGVDFDEVVKEALSAAEKVATGNWSSLRDIVNNVAQGLVNDAEFIATKKATGEFNESDARMWLDDQKMVARMRIRSLAIITMQIAESIWNAVAGVFNAAIQKALGWSVL